MKKYYLSDDFRRFNEVRSRKAQLAKREKEVRGVGFGDVSKGRTYIAHNRIMVTAPENFSITSNRDELMSFLKDFDSGAWHGQNVYVNLSKVNNITPDALLSIISYLNNYQGLLKKPHVSGNTPVDPYCKKVFLESGFYKFVSSSYTHHDTEDVLSIRSDEMVRPDEAAAVISFVRKRLNIKHKKMTRAIFTTIMEAMNNVREHAYDDRKNRRWWLMALPERDSDVIHFSLLDNGKGIPATIRKKLMDVIPFRGNDADLIRSTVLEKNRSETKLVYRGLGLPKMKKLVDDKMIKNLNIISKWGGYYIDGDNTYNLNSEYFGTLIYWDFVKES
jgi:anti-sigma regulatory factor (Ser/Thr protein kinase)